MGEYFAMSFTMQDFVRQVMKEEFEEMTPAEREEFLQSVPLKSRLAGLSEDQLQEYLNQLKASRKTETRKPRRKR
jgi:hypothetical protein